MLDPDRLVAHRGDMSRQPENTLPAFQAAIDAGARHLEFDLQFSRDGVPVVIHDPSVDRTTANTGMIWTFTAAELTRMPVRMLHPAPAVDPVFVPSLVQTAELLNAHADVHAFVELKRHSLERFGLQYCMDRTQAVLSGARFAWTLISFREDAVELARRRGLTCGWVLREHDANAWHTAQRLAPGYLFCNIDKLDPALTPFWPGPWRWVLYDIQDREQARRLLRLGVDLVETGCIGTLLERAPGPGTH